MIRIRLGLLSVVRIWIEKHWVLPELPRIERTVCWLYGTVRCNG